MAAQDRVPAPGSGKCQDRLTVTRPWSWTWPVGTGRHRLSLAARAVAAGEPGPEGPCAVPRSEVCWPEQGSLAGFGADDEPEKLQMVRRRSTVRFR